MLTNLWDGLGWCSKKDPVVNLTVYFAFEVTTILGFVFQVILYGFDPMVLHNHFSPPFWEMMFLSLFRIK